MSASLRMPPPNSQGTAGRLDYGPDAGKVLQPALPGAVQIDQVEMFGPQGDPVPRHGGRVLAEDGLAPVVALPQAHAFPTAQVNRRPDFHPFLAPVRTPGYEPKHVILHTFGAGTSGGSGLSRFCQGTVAGVSEVASRQIMVVTVPLGYPNSAKFFRIRSPSDWLFSGWNCVAYKLSRQTIEQNGPP